MGKGISRIRVTPSSGNVFADLGVSNAEQEHTRVRLAVSINHIIEQLGLSQVSAARRLSVGQPKISALSNDRLGGFSVERLIRFLNALDRYGEIVVRRKPRSRRAGRLLVTAA